MIRLTVSMILSVLIPVESAFAAATSPGGARVVTQDDLLRKHNTGVVMSENVPDEVSSDNWAYQSVAELQGRYGKAKPLPKGNCTKTELVDAFIDVCGRVVDEFKKRGAQMIRRDDIEDIRTLVVALEDELFRKKSYLNIRVRLERLLALVEPPVPIYRYKVGVNGFGRGEAADNFQPSEQSYAPGRDQARLVYRVKPFAYWHPDDRLNISAEGQAYGFTGGRKGVRTNGSLYQGYVEGKLPNSDFPGINWVSLKAGRQELIYGSAFMLGSDTFYDGLSYDAARLRVQPVPTTSLDLVGGSYAAPFSASRKGNLAGAYLSYKPSDDSSAEAYGFRDQGAVDRRPGEHLDFFGLRFTSPIGVYYSFEAEGVLERGKQFDPNSGQNVDIEAAGGHADLSGQFTFLGRDNAVFMSVATGTGDQNPAKEFRNPNNDSSLMGDMHVVADLSGFDAGSHHASGLQVYTFGWAIDLTTKLNLSATGRKFNASSVEPGFSHQIGTETDVNLTCSMNKDYSIITGYDHFFPGRFVTQASGRAKEADYIFTLLAFNYDWTRRKR